MSTKNRRRFREHEGAPGCLGTHQYRPNLICTRQCLVVSCDTDVRHQVRGQLSVRGMAGDPSMTQANGDRKGGGGGVFGV